MSNSVYGRTERQEHEHYQQQQLTRETSSKVHVKGWNRKVSSVMVA